MSIRQFQAQRMQAPRDFTAIPNTPICVEVVIYFFVEFLNNTLFIFYSLPKPRAA